MLICAFGEDIVDVELPYFLNGQREDIKISNMIRLVFRRQLDRFFSIQVTLFRNSGKYHISPTDRENRRNIQTLRNYL